jgi:hypothetical protein
MVILSDFRADSPDVLSLMPIRMFKYMQVAGFTGEAELSSALKGAEVRMKAVTL